MQSAVFTVYVLLLLFFFRWCSFSWTLLLYRSPFAQKKISHFYNVVVIQQKRILKFWNVNELRGEKGKDVACTSTSLASLMISFFFDCVFIFFLFLSVFHSLSLFSCLSVSAPFDSVRWMKLLEIKQNLVNDRLLCNSSAQCKQWREKKQNATWFPAVVTYGEKNISNSKLSSTSLQ